MQKMDGDREEPREYDIDMFTVACTDEVLASLEELHLKVEELQLSCEEYATRNNELQELLIKKEKEMASTKSKLENEISNLKKINLQILSQKYLQDNSIQKWINMSIGMIEKEIGTADLNSKIDQLTIKCLEKDKIISSLEWQLKDHEASLSTATAERNRLAAEVDELALRLEELEYVEALHRQGSVRSRNDVPGYDSDDESMGSNRNSAYQEENGGNPKLKRATNFTNINSLNLSSDFSMEPDSTSESSFTLGQGDLSKSDNMLAKDICKSFNRIYELRGETRYLSQSNNCIDRQLKLRSSMTERGQVNGDMKSLQHSQNKNADDSKPRVYVNGDYCEEIRAGLPLKLFSSPLPKRKERGESKSRSMRSTDTGMHRQFSERYVKISDTSLGCDTVSSKRKSSDPSIKTQTEGDGNRGTQGNIGMQEYVQWNNQDQKSGGTSKLKISMC